MYALRFKRSIAKDLRGIGEQAAERVLAAVEAQLAQDPRLGTRLRGGGALWRWRVGDSRVIYTFSDAELWILVVRIGHRRDVYRRLGTAILRERFGASSVLVFGSLAGEQWFGEASDIDLAASGLRADDYFTAMAAVQGLLGEFEVDLVDLDRCPPGLRETVLGEGVSFMRSRTGLRGSSYAKRR